MTPVIYILKVQIVFTVLFMLYYGFFRKEKFLVLNRLILIGIVAIAFVLPVSRTLNVNRLPIAHLQMPGGISAFPKFTANGHLSPGVSHLGKDTPQADYDTLAGIFYLAVAAVSLIILLINLYKVYAIIQAGYRQKQGKLIYCEPFNKTPPFSFFNYIVVAKKGLTPVEYEQIITHERAHSRQLHTLDVLLADIACILLWINPLAYLYRRQVKLNLEFLADEAALGSGLDARDYQLSLLRYSGILTAYGPVNAFFTSKIKERISMMNTERSGRYRGYKYILLLPAVLLLSFLVGSSKANSAVMAKISSFKKTVAISDRSMEKARPLLAKRANREQPLISPPLTTAQPATEQDNTNVYVDARTDTVKFTLVADTTGKRFKGIYVVDDKVLSDDEIRAGIKPTGRLDMILANRPILGVYSPNDSNAIKKWGERARPGVFFVKAPPEPTK